MGSQQFSTAVRGSAGDPINVSGTGSLETNDYDQGAAFDYDGSAYPYSLNPAETIDSLIITETGDIVARITTVSEAQFDLPLAGGSGVIDDYNIDTVEFRDPNGTTARIAGGWAGE